MDISNGIGLSLALRSCKSIKPVIVISKSTLGDRMEGIVKLSKILLSLFGAIERNLDSFTYVFTKFDKDEGLHIHHKVAQKLKA